MVQKKTPAKKKAAKPDYGSSGGAYDVLSVRFPKGYRAIVKEEADKLGLTQNDLIKIATTALVEELRNKGRISLPLKFAIYND